MKRAKLSAIAGAICAALLCGHNANADLIAYEGFDYPDGADLSGQFGGTGFGAAWTATSGDTAVAASLQYIDAMGNVLASSGNHGHYTGAGGTSSPFRDLPIIRGDDGTTSWVSFVGQRLGDKIGDPPHYLRGTNISLFNRTLPASTEQLAIGQGTGRTEDTWSFIPDGAAASTVASDDPFDVLSLVVVRIDHLPGNDNAYMFVNPILGVEPDIANADAVSLGAFDYSFNSVRPFAGNTQAANGTGEIQLDEIRIGTTYNDVTPVPEPAQLTVLALGALALKRRRR